MNRNFRHYVVVNDVIKTIIIFVITSICVELFTNVTNIFEALHFYKNGESKTFLLVALLSADAICTN